MDDSTYKRYTDLFNKENELIKNRINWLFGTQTLLFGILKIPKAYEASQCIIVHYEAFQSTIVHVGFWSSILYFMSILAAVITYLRFHFIHPEIEESEKGNYPEFNRSTAVLILGFIAALGMPIIFIGAWYFQF